MAIARRRRRRKKRYLSGTIDSVKGGTCKYRSSWELAYINFLDRDPSVVSFSYEMIKIPYVSNLRSKRIRNYLPDFFVTRADGSTQLVEIKSSRRVSNLTVQKKAAAAERWSQEHGASFVMLTEKELVAMGLLGK